MCFHWVASFGFDGADVRKENRFKKKKKVERRRWDEGRVLYRFVDTWVVWEEEQKELKKKWDDIYDTWEG